MEPAMGKIIHNLRMHKNISQSALAEHLGITVQAVSKWEVGKASPDLQLIPKLAKFFDVSIDHLFSGEEAEDDFADETLRLLEKNHKGWSEIANTDWKGTILPQYGPFTPNEEQLHLLGDVRNKAVLEIACGGGESLLYMKDRGAREIWGTDISPERIKKAQSLLEEESADKRLLVSPMETDPGLPHRHFDIVYSIYGIGWTLDLDRTVALVAEYLKPGGIFVFSWDNPLLPCLDAVNGRYVLADSYVAEKEIELKKKGAELHIKNWKLSSYLNTLARHQFRIEQVVEETTAERTGEACATADHVSGKYYSEEKAGLMNLAFVIKARKQG